MYFDCQIRLTVKELRQEYCDVPECPDPVSFSSTGGKRNRHRRFAPHQNIFNSTNDDKKVSTSNQTNSPAESWSLLGSTAISTFTSRLCQSWVPKYRYIPNFKDEEVCMTGLGLSSIALLNIALLFASGVLLRNSLFYKGSHSSFT